MGIEGENQNVVEGAAENENIQDNVELGAEQGANADAVIEDAQSDADSAGDADNTGDAEVVEAKDWKAEAEALMAQMDSYKEQAVRAQAEMQNIRRRAEMDVEKAHKFALEKFAKELLPVIDSLEKALESEKASNNETTALREGVEMTLGMFLGGVKKFNLEQIEAVGQPFNPEFHEAMSMVEAPGAEANSVIAEMQKGYTLNGRLVRPAMVMVAK